MRDGGDGDGGDGGDDESAGGLMWLSRRPRLLPLFIIIFVGITLL